MRISDWSSDVCSSDLVGGRPSYPQLGAQPNLIGYVMAPRTKLSQLPSCDQVIYNPTTRKFEAPDAVVRAITREAGVDETRTVNSREITYFVSPSGKIGRASWRERVCQYV